MTDEKVESSTTEESGTQATSESSGGTESTQENSENMVPQSRFKEVIDERNTAREELGGLKERIAALETEGDPGEKNEAVYETKAPPEGLSKEQEIEWWVRKFSGPQVQEIVEKELGMSLQDAKVRLDKSDETAKTAEQTQWNNACAVAGLDPNDSDVQGIASGLARTMGEGANIADVLSKTAKYVGATKKANGDTGANVEQGGVSGVMASPDWVPKNSADASAGAKSGRRAKHRSTVDIIEARLAAEASKG